MRVNRTVATVLSAHIIKMVTSLQIIPILTNAFILYQADALAQAVQLVDSLILKDVTHPSASVACFVGPRNGMHYRELANWLHLAHNLTWCHELDIVLSSKTRQRLHELKDTTLARLKLTKCLIVHKQVHKHLLFRKRSYPVNIFVGS